MIKSLYSGSRVLLGLIFFVFGLNGFIELFPVMDGLNTKALSFLVSIKNVYLYTFIKGIEVCAGILLLCNQFVLLSLTLLAPIVVNIFLFHLFLQPSELLIAFVVIILEIFLLAFHFESLKPLFKRR